MSRTLVSVVVVVLIVIAIVGIVLAGRKATTTGAPPGDAAVTGSTPGTGAQPTAGRILPPEPVQPPTEVRFVGSTDKLPPEASGELARFADIVRGNDSHNVGLTARFLTGGDKAAAMELGRKRVAAVQHALEANGISARRIQGEMVEMPAGALLAGDANRVELNIRPP